jgi:hypothetical protein
MAEGSCLVAPPILQLVSPHSTLHPVEPTR